MVTVWPCLRLVSGGLDNSSSHFCTAGGILEAPANVWGLYCDKGELCPHGEQQRGGGGVCGRLV